MTPLAVLPSSSLTSRPCRCVPTATTAASCSFAQAEGVRSQWRRSREVPTQAHRGLPRSGNDTITSEVASQPPARLPAKAPIESRSNCHQEACPAATTVTGTRKPSLNSSLWQMEQSDEAH